MGQVFSAVDTYLKIHEENEEDEEDAIIPSGEYSPPLKLQKANERTVPCPPAPQRPRPGVFNLGYAYPWGYVGSFQGVREHHCRICIILLEKVGVDCMWSAEPIGDVHFTAS